MSKENRNRSVAFFHDQKSVDHPSGEYPVVDSVIQARWERDEERRKQYSESIKKNIENPESQTEESVLEETLNKINQAELEDVFKDDAEQKQLLEIRKKQAKEMIKGVIDKAMEYIDKVEVNVMSQRMDASDETKKQLVEASDRNRTYAHEALLDSLRSSIRNISHNFGNINEEAIEQWGDFLEKHKQKLLMVKRQDFPKNVVCPDNVNIKDRYSVAEWAGRLQESLSVLPPELK